MKTYIEKSLIIALVLSFNITFSSQLKKTDDFYNLDILIKDNSGELEKSLCNLVIEDVNNHTVFYKRNISLNTKVSASLQAGRYELHSYVTKPRYDVVTEVNIPESTSVQLDLKKPNVHNLRVKIVDADDAPMVSAHVRISFSGPLAKSGFRSIINSSNGVSNKGSSHSLPVNADGIAEFEFQGPVPECRLRVYGSNITEIVTSISPSVWDTDNALIIKTKTKSINGNITCYFDNGDSVLQLTEGLNSYFGSPPEYLIARLISVLNSESLRLNYFTFLFDSNDILLYDLADGEYFIEKVEASSFGKNMTLYSENNLPIIIKNGKILPKYSKVTLADNNHRHLLSVEFLLTENNSPIDKVRVGILHPLIQTSLVSDANGICTARLPEGNYAVSFQHTKYSPLGKVINVDNKHTSFKISMESLPVVKGKVAYQGKPVSNVEVFAFYDYDLDDNYYMAHTDSMGEYSISVARNKPFAMGVRYEKFWEILNIKDDQSKIETVNFDLTPRRQIEINISDISFIQDYQDKNLILLLTHFDKGLIATLSPIDKDGKTNLNLIPGAYDFFIMTPEEKFYNIGKIDINISQKAIDIPTQNHSPLINREQLKNLLKTKSSVK